MSEAIWDINVGDELEATETMMGEDMNPPYAQVPFFTKGKRYAITEVFPLRPSVTVTDDTGERNFIIPGFIEKFLVHKQKVAA